MKRGERDDIAIGTRIRGENGLRERADASADAVYVTITKDNVEVGDTVGRRARLQLFLVYNHGLHVRLGGRVTGDDEQYMDVCSKSSSTIQCDLIVILEGSLIVGLGNRGGLTHVRRYGGERTHVDKKSTDTTVMVGGGQTSVLQSVGSTLLRSSTHICDDSNGWEIGGVLELFMRWLGGKWREDKGIVMDGVLKFDLLIWGWWGCGGSGARRQTRQGGAIAIRTVTDRFGKDWRVGQSVGGSLNMTVESGIANLVLVHKGQTRREEFLRSEHNKEQRHKLLRHLSLRGVKTGHVGDCVGLIDVVSYMVYSRLRRTRDICWGGEWGERVDGKGWGVVCGRGGSEDDTHSEHGEERVSYINFYASYTGVVSIVNMFRDVGEVARRVTGRRWGGSGIIDGIHSDDRGIHFLMGVGADVDMEVESVWGFEGELDWSC
ncbi:hypothetical protein Tco_0004419 [Tanacetum coccineum]